jgi:WXG100 family type VII secretion target
MAGDLVQFNYGQIEQMEGELQKGAQRLQETRQHLAQIAASFHQGNFEGLAGEAFATGLAQALSKGVDNLAQYYIHMANGLRQAAAEMVQQDAKGKF